MLQRFQRYDADGDGFVSTTELRDMLSEDNDEEYDDDEMEEIINKVDADHDGELTFQDFFSIFI